MTTGFISQRNEDGTSWYTTVYGVNCWADDRAERRAFPKEEYDRIAASVEESKKNDCPDNGFFGIYNLTWHPCTQEEADAANRLADAAQLEDEDEEYDEPDPSYEDDAFDYEESCASRRMEAFDLWRNEY